MLTIITTLRSSENHTFDEYSAWYIAFLESRFRDILHSHLEPCLEGLCKSSVDNEVLILVYRFMTIVAENLKEKDQLTLQDIVTFLERKGIFKPASPPSHQLVFISIGWLTMLYDPVYTPGLDLQKLQINTFSRTSGNPLQAAQYYEYTQGLSQIHQPLNALFLVFGHLIPRPEAFPSPEGVANANPYHTEYLILSCLCYDTLHKVGKISIEWVDSLGLHLEFDETNKVLKVFRWPSYCRMVYAGEKRGTFLNR